METAIEFGRVFGVAVSWPTIGDIIEAVAVVAKPTAANCRRVNRELIELSQATRKKPHALLYSSPIARQRGTSLASSMNCSRHGVVVVQKVASA